MNTLKTCSLLLFVVILAASVHGQEPDTKPPQQVIVSVKIIEFQATKGIETGLSAYYKKLPRTEPFGKVSLSGNAINTADLTFPSSTAAGLSVFLDRISMDSGDIEVVLQALVDENKATILFRPRAMVRISPDPAAPVFTEIKTSQNIPYEDTTVVGSTAVQVVKSKDTGVVLKVAVPDITDDDNDFNTSHDTFIKLNVDAQVAEEGQRIVVALDDQLAAGGNFAAAQNAIQVPEFVTRKITTQVWVPVGETLVLGGLYRNNDNRALSTAPFLKQTENAISSAVDAVIPGDSFALPLSATIGNRRESQTRRELVFLIKAEVWKPSYSLGNELGFDDTDLFDLAIDEEDVSSEDLVDEVPATPAEGEAPAAEEGAPE